MHSHVISSRVCSLFRENTENLPKFLAVLRRSSSDHLPTQTCLSLHRKLGILLTKLDRTRTAKLSFSEYDKVLNCCL